MSKYRSRLPQISSDVFLTEGGTTTTLIYHRNLVLPHFASFVLLETEDGRNELRRCYLEYIDVAQEYGLGLILDTATWRANPDWGRKLGYNMAALAEIDRASVELLLQLRAEHETDHPIVISGTIGPRGDGYANGEITAFEAKDYHWHQVKSFADTQVDMIGAWTLSSIGEAIGITRAAVENDMPVSISFTVETDGRLASGISLGEAIEKVDAATDCAPKYYMINCSHPSHFASTFDSNAYWTRRVRGIRGNASTGSHAELDQMVELDEGDPQDLGTRYSRIRDQLPSVNIVGGCCGTDCKHIRAICEACL